MAYNDEYQKCPGIMRIRYRLKINQTTWMSLIEIRLGVIARWTCPEDIFVLGYLVHAV